MSIRRWSRNRTSHHRVGERAATRRFYSRLFLRPLPPSSFSSLLFSMGTRRRNLLTPQYIAICSARYKAIEYVCQYRGIEPSNLPREEILTVISPVSMAQPPMIPAEITSPWDVDPTAIAPPLIPRKWESSSFSRRADFSCSTYACYSFVDRGSSEKHAVRM